MPIIKYFGLIADLTGKEEEQWLIKENTTVENMQQQLQEAYSELTEASYKIAVNQQFVEAQVLIKENDEIALLPPFAGG